MATLDKHAEPPNWDTVGGRRRLPREPDAPVANTGDVGNRYVPTAQDIVEGRKPSRETPPRKPTGGVPVDPDLKRKQARDETASL